MPVPRDAILLAIFIGEEDCLQHQALYGAIALKAREQPLAGASVLRGPLGFGHFGRLHTTKVLRLLGGSAHRDRDRRQPGKKSTPSWRCWTA
jgi:hypothetical protein